MEEFGGKAYRMGKGSKDDAVVALLKDQLDEFKQVHNMAQSTCNSFCLALANNTFLTYSTGVTAKVIPVRLKSCVVKMWIIEC